MKLLERSIGVIDRRLVLLAPDGARPEGFANLAIDAHRRRELIREMQRLRGHIYFSQGSIQAHQLSDGMHQTPEDEKSWHLLMLNKEGRVNACAWYLPHPNTTSIQDLRVRHCPLIEQEGWREKVQGAVESEIARARRDALRYAEVGGWAVSRESRCTSEGLLLALAAYSLSRLLGGALGITTATVEHCSSRILRRLGGSYLEYEGKSIPAYHDPRYNCDIELLRFDSRRPNPRYAGLIELMKSKLADVSVVAGSVQECTLSAA